MTSSNIRVSDILIIEKVHVYPVNYTGMGMESIISHHMFSFQNQRVPADIVLLRTTEKSGKIIIL